MVERMLYRIPEVAEALGISRSKVYELMAAGDLRSVRIARTRLVRAIDLRSYVDALEAISPAGAEGASKVGEIGVA